MSGVIDNPAQYTVRMKQLSQEIPEAMRKRQWGDALRGLAEMDKTVSALRLYVNHRVESA